VRWSWVSFVCFRYRLRFGGLFNLDMIWIGRRVDLDGGACSDDSGIPYSFINLFPLLFRQTIERICVLRRPMRLSIRCRLRILLSLFRSVGAEFACALIGEAAMPRERRGAEGHGVRVGRAVGHFRAGVRTRRERLAGGHGKWLLSSLFRCKDRGSAAFIKIEGLCSPLEWRELGCWRWEDWILEARRGRNERPTHASRCFSFATNWGSSYLYEGLWFLLERMVFD
jgi:hypothetical protein